MNARAWVGRIVANETLNYTLTNRLPRRQLNRFMAWFSRIRNPVVRRLSIATWRYFADVDLSDAMASSFASLHDCFTRQLRPGARPFIADAATLASPCDAIVGATGTIVGDDAVQAKGRRYPLSELLEDPALARHYVGGTYATLRITAGMYHRFHAPYDCRVTSVTHIAGDTFNVNPPALRRVDRLYCRNERAVIRCRLVGGSPGGPDVDGQLVTLVPVAAILVGGIRLHCADLLLHGRYRGPRQVACDARLRKGDEMGWFEHGSTIIVLVPAGWSLADGLAEGAPVRTGEALMWCGRRGDSRAAGCTAPP